MKLADICPTVTLNSFQGPFLVSRRCVVGGTNLTVAHLTRASADGARWMLKQVQHDDFVREAAE
ncbi:MAG: hypothetical protein APF82_07165 [Sphingomonadales bacterium BRH_c42]|nr:MAG: hypothetical protein APF82_07165 [Sphingomonadales bacterium BRH_c42]